MRPLIFVLAIVSLFACSMAFAHGRHGGSNHSVSLGRSSALAGINNNGPASGENRSDAKSNAEGASPNRVADTDKPHRKSGRAPDEEEVMQAEH